MNDLGDYLITFYGLAILMELDPSGDWAKAWHDCGYFRGKGDAKIPSDYKPLKIIELKWDRTIPNDHTRAEIELEEELEETGHGWMTYRNDYYIFEEELPAPYQGHEFFNF